LQFLQNIDGGVVNTNQMMNTVIEELRLMRMSLDSGKGPAAKPKQITQSELADPNIVDDTDFRGSNKKIARKCYRTTINVACIPFASSSETDQEASNRKDKQLAILSKLSECTNILKFYGLANLDGVNHLVVEWAQYGTLRETYEAYDIPWTRKLHIATDICRAITFLHSAEIYHHDLRCENIMLTDHLEPKLANFEYARISSATTSSIADLMRIIHWLSPEKMFDKNTRYNAKCEIFRYSINLLALKYNYLKLITNLLILL
jgi:serine/threonine protein kinase